jgi:hypothetical protein
MLTYDQLYAHMQHHKIKQWLLSGAKAEDARTIYDAVSRISEQALIRRLCRALLKER